MGKQTRPPVTANKHEVEITRAILSKTDPDHSYELTHAAAEGPLLRQLKLPDSESTPKDTFNAAWEFIVQLRAQECRRSWTSRRRKHKKAPNIAVLRRSFTFEWVERLVRLLGYAQTGEMHALLDADTIRDLLQEPGPECRIYDWIFTEDDIVFAAPSPKEAELFLAIMIQNGQCGLTGELQVVFWLEEEAARTVLRRSGLEGDTLHRIWYLVRHRERNPKLEEEPRSKRFTKNDVVAMLRLVSYALQQPFHLHARLYETRQLIPAILVKRLLSSEQRPQIPSSSISPVSTSVTLPLTRSSPPPLPPKPAKNDPSNPLANDLGPTPAIPAPVALPPSVVTSSAVVFNPVTVQEPPIPRGAANVTVATSEGVQSLITEKTTDRTNTTGTVTSTTTTQVTTPQVTSTSQPPQSSLATQLRPATSVQTSETPSLRQSSPSTAGEGAIQSDGSHGVNPTFTDADSNSAGRDGPPARDSIPPKMQHLLTEATLILTPNTPHDKPLIHPASVQSTSAGIQRVTNVQIPLPQAISPVSQAGLFYGEIFGGPAEGSRDEDLPPAYTPTDNNRCVDPPGVQTPGSNTGMPIHGDPLMDDKVPNGGSTSRFQPAQMAVGKTRGSRPLPQQPQHGSSPGCTSEVVGPPLQGDQEEEDYMKRAKELRKFYNSEPTQPSSIAAFPQTGSEHGLPYLSQSPAYAAVRDSGLSSEIELDVY